MIFRQSISQKPGWISNHNQVFTHILKDNTPHTNQTIIPYIDISNDGRMRAQITGMAYRDAARYADATGNAGIVANDIVVADHAVW